MRPDRDLTPKDIRKMVEAAAFFVGGDSNGEAWDLNREIPTKDTPGAKPNLPDAQGRQMGALLAKWADEGERELRQHFPKHAPRCNDCALRQGTDPNGSVETLGDVMACLLRDVPFHCHKGVPDEGQPHALCAGWMMARSAPKFVRFMKFMAALAARKSHLPEVESEIDVSPRDRWLHGDVANLLAPTTRVPAPAWDPTKP